MKLINSYTDTSRQGVTVYEYWNDDGTPVEIKVHYDPYPQQCYGVASRWTERNGYERIVTADPHRVNKDDLEQIVADLFNDYQAMRRSMP